MSETPWQPPLAGTEVEHLIGALGHADLLCEAVDGRVGEDPPPGWQRRSGG
jgi:hypothetical protein